MTTIDISMSSEEYHSIPAVNASLLKQIARSPAHARAYMTAPQETTAAMAFGTAFHACVLEPEKFAENYIVFSGDRRTKAGKEDYEAILKANRIPLSDDDYSTITLMAGAIGDHDAAASFVRDREGNAEASVFWRDERTGLQCKCRPDIWLGKVLVDVKTTDDASPEGFAKSIVKYGYHLQAAHYLEGTGAESFVFVAVEKKPPYAVAVYVLDQLSLQYAIDKRNALLDYWADCQKAALFPAYSTGIQTISLPNWAFNQEIEE